MKRDIKVNNKTNIYAYLLVLSFFSSRISLSVGFHIKPYMVVTLIGMIVFWDKLRAKPLITIFDFEKYFLLYLSIYVLTLAYSVNFHASVRWIGLIVINVIVMIVNSKILLEESEVVFKSLKDVTGFLIALSLIFYFLGCFNLDFDYSNNRVTSLGLLTDRGIPRLLGVFSHDPNIAMFNMTPLFFIFLVDHESVKDKVVLVLIVITTLLTFSRGGIVGYLLSCIIYITFKSKKSTFINFFKILSVILILDYIVYLTSDNSLLITFFDRFKSSITGGGSGRTELWKASLETARDNLIFGTGINTSQFTTVASIGHPKYIHNTYIEILTDGGLILSAVYLNYVRVQFKNINHIQNGKNREFLFLTMLAMLTQAVFLSLTINEFWFFMIFLLKLEYEKTRKVESRYYEN